MSDPQTPASSTPDAAPDLVLDGKPGADTIETIAAPKSSAPPPPPPPARPAKSGSNGLAAFALLVAIGGVGAVGYYAWQQQAEVQREMQRLAAELAALEVPTDLEDPRVPSLQQSLTQLTQTEQELRAQLQQVQASRGSELENLNREISALRTKVNDGGAAAGVTLRFNEAGALLRLAQERLVVARDVPAALTLMQGADDLLRQANDSSAFTLREALAQDMTALQMVETVDVSGLYARLGAAAERIPQLTVQPGGEMPAFRVQESTADPDAPRSWWEDILAYLDRYFVITRDVAEVVPVLGSDQTWLIEERLRLQVEAARIALLQGEASVYQRALDDVIAGVDQLMQGDGKAELLSELRALRGSPIQTSIPPAARALDALRQLQPAERLNP